MLDTHPPKVLDASASRATVSPDGDNIGDTIKISYRFSSPAHAVLYLDSRRILYSRSHQSKGKLSLARQSPDGQPLKAGTYTLYLGGVDLAGNVTPVNARRPIVVRVRYIRLLRDVVTVKRPGVRFGIGVDTDAKTYWWKLNGSRGVSAARVLRLHAPRRPGTYTLTVGEQNHTSRAKLVVGPGR